MFTQFLKISPVHSYQIHQNLQPPLDFGTPPKGPAPPVYQKFPSLTENFRKSPAPLQPGGIDTMVNAVRSRELIRIL